MSVKNLPIAVAGAAGHTGRFVVDELARRRNLAVLVGRDRERLLAAAARQPAAGVRVADFEDPRSLDAALSGTAAVINCAGPFGDTALALFEGALRARIAYLDVTAEQPAAAATFACDARARRAGIVALPATAFFGGLADLLASSLAAGLETIERIDVAVALDRWHPTRGTRLTGERNTAARLVVSDGKLGPVEKPQAPRSWTFPAPFGTCDVELVQMTETIALARHLDVRTVRSWISSNALRDVADPSTPEPTRDDARGRSEQRFVMDVALSAASERRRIRASGRDIYAVSASIVVEAALRLLEDTTRYAAGVHSAGSVFDAADFLDALVRAGDLHVERFPPGRLAADADRGVAEERRDEVSREIR